MRKPPDLVRLAMSAGVVFAAIMAPAAVDADTGSVVDCAPPPPLEQAIAGADLVFVGLVTSTANADRTASVLVSEVWQGDVDEIVTINGGSDPGTVGEDDRSYTVGSTYLFFPVLQDGRLVDNTCSSTVPWGDKIASLRPQVTRPPNPATRPAPGPFAFLGTLAQPLWTAAIIGGGAYAFALLVARRRDA